MDTYRNTENMESIVSLQKKNQNFLTHESNFEENAISCDAILDGIADLIGTGAPTH